MQRQIDLVPRANLLNGPHYSKYEEFNSQVEDLIAKGKICESLSLCVPALLTLKKDESW